MPVLDRGINKDLKPTLRERPGSRSSMLDQLMLQALLDCSPPLTSDPEAFQRNQLN
jgi:hypothetical protein